MYESPLISEEKLNLFEGDIVLKSHDHVGQRKTGDVDGPLPGSQTKRGGVIRMREKIWKSKVVPYEMDVRKYRKMLYMLYHFQIATRHYCLVVVAFPVGSSFPPRLHSYFPISLFGLLLFSWTSILSRLNLSNLSNNIFYKKDLLNFTRLFYKTSFYNPNSLQLALIPTCI